MRTFASSMNFSQTALFFDFFPVFILHLLMSVCTQFRPLIYVYPLIRLPWGLLLNVLSTWSGRSTSRERTRCTLSKRPRSGRFRREKHLALVGIRTSLCPSCSLFTMHITPAPLSTTEYVPLTLRNRTETPHRVIRVYLILRNFCFTQVKYSCPAKSEYLNTTTYDL
jgi:hypothetical protein